MFGAFLEPDSLAMSAQMSYRGSTKLTLRLTAANVIVNCFGGSKTAWTTIPFQAQAGCWYGTPTAYVGNFYNPGNNIQQ